jgi:hypothetical protein
MNKFLIMLTLCAFTLMVKAQQPVPKDEDFGKIDQSDLEMKACDFEKDANAEVLIDKGDLYYDQNFNVVLESHRRIKIFNEQGKGYADFKFEYRSYNREEYISGLQAETINLVDGKPEIIKLDKKQVYNQVVDKYYSAVVFTMPNVKPGSIIDIKYTRTRLDPSTIPGWNFQDEIPVRYSEYDTAIPEYFNFQTKSNLLTPFTTYVNTTGSGNIGSGSNVLTYSTSEAKRVLVNIHSLNKEPHMSSMKDNLLSIHFDLASFRPPNGFVSDFANTWTKLGERILDDEDFGSQLRKKLAGEEEIINKAKALKTDDEKIAYIFNTVKNSMKWDDIDRWYTIDGTSDAWNKKTGNSTEINLILYHLLYKSGINKALPMLVSTRDNGRVNPIFKFIEQFNRTVVYIPVDSTKKYILDASSKYNVYDETPFNLLNSSGFYLNKEDNNYDLIFLDNEKPIRQSIFITAEIKPDGKIDGNAQISSTSYDRCSRIEQYQKDGEKKYITSLTDDDNNLKIKDLKMGNLEVDSLPLVEDVNFNLDLTGSDDNYIYFNSNLFSSLHKNPFLSETRSSDIDFGYLSTLIINGIYKEPAGYKVDALPKNISMTMPDKSIVFKRIIGEQDGSIVVRYVINYNKSIYFKENYGEIHEFFKQMFQMINEQIVLKKS